MKPVSLINASPAVEAEAKRRGVNPFLITATGPGGRISMADVHRAAGDGTAAPKYSLPAHPAGASANPLLTAARGHTPDRVVRASAQGPAPTLFPSGDLPAFTASGIDPKALMAAPWQARHAIAAAPTTAEAYRLLDDYSGPEGAVAAELEQGHHPGNQFYAGLMRAWLADAATADETYAQLFPEKGPGKAWGPGQ